MALQEGRRFLHEGRPSLAIPAALEALKFLTEVYGGADIQLTPAYLILAEAAIGRLQHLSALLVYFYRGLVCKSVEGYKDANTVWPENLAGIKFGGLVVNSSWRILSWWYKGFIVWIKWLHGLLYAPKSLFLV